MPPVFMRLRVEKRLFSALYSLVQMRVYPPYPIGAKEFRSVTILTFRSGVDNFTKYATNDFGLKNLRTVTRQSLFLKLE